MSHPNEDAANQLLKRQFWICSGLVVLAVAALIVLLAVQEPADPNRDGFVSFLSTASGFAQGIGGMILGALIVVVTFAYVLVSTVLVVFLRRREYALWEAHAATLAALLVWFALVLVYMLAASVMT